MSGGTSPSVSLVVTTRDRPEFLPVVLACCRYQTYADCETIVVDDGEQFPIDPAAVAGAGGRLIRVEPGTPLGTKLNLGLVAARGAVCCKIDDDDWYGPDYVQTMVARLMEDWKEGPRASLVIATGYLLFDLARWEIRRSYEAQYAGATLCFRREDWEAHPFRPIANGEDATFYSEQVARGTRPLAVATPETFIAVRHPNTGVNRGHTWVAQPGFRTVEEHLLERPLHERGPAELLPPWAIDVYWNLRRQLRPSDKRSGGEGEGTDVIDSGGLVTDLGLFGSRARAGDRE